MNNKHIDRITGMGITPENCSFSISSRELIQAISEEVDLETVTDHELKEILFIVTKAITRMDWKSTVTYAVEHLPFGLNQTSIAWNGIKPCSTDCPDAMLEDDHCYHKHACKAWEIYEANF